MFLEKFPKPVDFQGLTYTFRLMTPKDRNTILSFAQRLSEADLLFMRRDITQPEAIEEWIHDLEHNRATSLLVEDNGKLIGYGTLYYNQLFWNRHLAETRVMVSAAYRNKGVGATITRFLVQFAEDYGLAKVLAYMSADDKGARRMFEELGFKAEALLADWVKTRDDRMHDLLIMSLALSDV